MCEIDGLIGLVRRLDIGRSGSMKDIRELGCTSVARALKQDAHAPRDGRLYVELRPTGERVLAARNSTGSRPKDNGTVKRKKHRRATRTEMANRNRAVAMAAAELKLKYDRLPTVAQVAQKTGIARKQIYSTAAYKENRIAKVSAKLTSEVVKGSTPSEYHRKGSAEGARVERRSKAEQDQLDGLIDQQAAEDDNPNPLD